MEHLYQTERHIINELLDRGIFTSSVTPEMRKSQASDIESLARPSTQRHINRFMKKMFATVPQNFRGNLLFLSGDTQLSAADKHVLLATCKAVINAPEMQGVTSDRVILCATLVTMVNSEVTELDEKKIRKTINHLFIDRFKLFSVDNPLESDVDEAVEIQEYWDVSPDFTGFVKCLVAALNAEQVGEEISDIQRVNRYLLQHQYLDAKWMPQLWQTLQQNKTEIEENWHELARYYLECGTDYALLLDDYRRPSESRQFYAAVKVAQSLGIGLPKDTYHQRIKQVWRQLYPSISCNITAVKDVVEASGLVTEVSGLLVATPLAKRYAVQLDEENN